MAAVDSKSGSEPARSAGQIECTRGFAMTLHQRDSLERLNRADENRRGGSGWFADNVEHEMRAIVEKDVGVAGSEIHRADSRRWATKMMTGWIAGWIGFDFDNSPTQTASTEIVHDDFANEEARELDGVLGKFIALQTAQRKFSVVMDHGNAGYLPAALCEEPVE